jgi:hypothetical protein
MSKLLMNSDNLSTWTQYFPGGAQSYNLLGMLEEGGVPRENSGRGGVMRESRERHG